MVGSAIKKIRRRKKLTQGQLAGWLGVSRQAVAMWELGKREIRVPTLEKIARVFGVQVNEIITLKNALPTKKEANMPRKTKQPTQKKKKITFELTAPAAKKVRLTGDFNSWDNNGITMRRNKTGVWKTGVALNSGDYQYKFIVDDQWWTDPNNEWKVTNSFGAENSVVKVS